MEEVVHGLEKELPGETLERNVKDLIENKPSMSGNNVVFRIECLLTSKGRQSTNIMSSYTKKSSIYK